MSQVFVSDGVYSAARCVALDLHIPVPPPPLHRSLALAHALDPEVHLVQQQRCSVLLPGDTLSVALASDTKVGALFGGGAGWEWLVVHGGGGRAGEG